MLNGEYYIIASVFYTSFSFLLVLALEILKLAGLATISDFAWFATLVGQFKFSEFKKLW